MSKPSCTLPKSHKPWQNHASDNNYCPGHAGSGDGACLLCKGTAAPTQSAVWSPLSPRPIPPSAAKLIPARCRPSKPPQLDPRDRSSPNATWKAEPLGCQKRIMDENQQPSARSRDRLCCVFSHVEQTLKEKPESSSTDSWCNNLQGRGKQAAGLIPSWKKRNADQGVKHPWELPSSRSAAFSPNPPLHGVWQPSPVTLPLQDSTGSSDVPAGPAAPLASAPAVGIKHYSNFLLCLVSARDCQHLQSSGPDCVPC